MVTEQERAAWAKGVLARISFRALPLPLHLGATATREHGAIITIWWTVPDVEDPEMQPLTLRSAARIPPSCDEAGLVTLVRRLALAILAHELREFMTLDGARVADPHPGGTVNPFLLDWAPVHDDSV